LKLLHAGSIGHTTAGRVVSGLLAEVRGIVHCKSISARVLRLGSSDKSEFPKNECQSCRLSRGIIGGGRTLRTEEVTGDVQILAADDDDLLTAEELLCDDTGESTQKVTLAIDHDLR
jgi:hypothetical protein